MQKLSTPQKKWWRPSSSLTSPPPPQPSLLVFLPHFLSFYFDVCFLPLRIFMKNWTLFPLIVRPSVLNSFLFISFSSLFSLPGSSPISHFLFFILFALPLFSFFFKTSFLKTISKEAKGKERTHNNQIHHSQSRHSPSFSFSPLLLLHPLFGFTPLPHPPLLAPTFPHTTLHLSEEKRSWDELSPVIKEIGAAESGKRTKRKRLQQPRREWKGERWRRKKQPISLKQGLISAFVSTNEIPCFV